MKIKIFIIPVVLTMIIFAGCDSGRKADYTVPGEVSYPINTDETLTYWNSVTDSVYKEIKDFSETPFAREYKKKTGINIKYYSVSGEQEKEMLNILFASGDLPDIIETDWLSRDPDACIEDGTILRLNDYIDKYSPNLKAYLDANSDVNKQIKTDTGSYYVYPFIREDELLQSTEGIILRADWLREFGLSVPETLDEWDMVLASFKTKCEFPISMISEKLQHFAGVYGIRSGLYIDDGTVHYGAVKSEYRQFLEKMHSWYEKGYIDRNMSIMDAIHVRKNILESKSGVFFAAGGRNMGLFLDLMEDINPEFDLCAAPFPVMNKGDYPKFGNQQWCYSPISCAAITGDCDNPVLAARILDFSYSEEGRLLNNFGIEGVSYNLVDGEPIYTDIITDNPEGLYMSEVMPYYIRAAGDGPFIQDSRYITQYYRDYRQKEALRVWGANDDIKHSMPQLTLTSDEAEEYNRIMYEISAFHSEMFVKFVIGTESIENFDEYVAGIEAMNLKKALEIQQRAYERFLKR